MPVAVLLICVYTLVSARELEATNVISKRRRQRPQRKGRNYAPKLTTSLSNANDDIISNSTTTTTPPANLIPFRGLTQFNASPKSRSEAGFKQRLTLKPFGKFQSTLQYFPLNKDTLLNKLALSLAKYEAIDMKEFAESMEFFQHARTSWRKTIKKQPKAATIIDLCCGHGFTGILFAIFERKCTSVILADRERPKSFTNINRSILTIN